jgi:hypothetical protein
MAPSIEGDRVETLLDVHSVVRWLVLVAVVAAIVIALLRRSRGMTAGAGFPRVAVMVIDIQVLLGIALWLFDEGWNESFFFKVIHPLFMLLAAGVAHMAVVMGRRRPERADLTTVIGFGAALVLMVAAIPWDRI